MNRLAKKRKWSKTNRPKLYAGAIVVVTLVTGTVIVAVLKCTGSRESELVNKPVPNPPLPTPVPSRFQNASADVSYVGSQTCKRCHEEYYATYSLTAHSRSMRVVHADSQPPDGEVFHDATGLIYTSYREGGQIRHKEEVVANGERHLVADFPLKYVVGSGRFARSYLIERDGLLVESPLSWYTSTGRWSLSPGFEDDAHPTFWRTIPTGCLGCHSGDARPASDRLGHITIKEATIGCERCHGPGELHVSKWEQHRSEATTTEDLTIVNPGTLSRELADDVCAQCHLQSAARIRVRGQEDGAFRPGRRLRDYYVDYRLDPPSGQMEVVGHVEQLKASRCYQQSLTLTCITCHDPHLDTAPRREYWRKNCLACHQEEQCGENKSHRVVTGRDDCVQCHMPQSPTEVPHVVFTHHRIGIHPQADGHDVQRSGRQVVPVTSIDDHPELDRKRALGLASARVYLENQHEPAFRPIGQRASQLLLEVSEKGILDEEVALALGSFAIMNGDNQAALRMAERGLRQSAPPVTRIRLLRLALDACLNQSQFQAAKEVLLCLVDLQEDVEYWHSLGLCEMRLGNQDEAARAFERATELDPLHAASYEARAELYEGRGQAERAARVRNRLGIIPQALRSGTGP